MIKPKLDYLYQYPVKRVFDAIPDDAVELGEGDPVWGIEFENGAIVANYDAEKPLPDIEGLTLVMCFYSNDETRAVFGRVKAGTTENPAPQIANETVVVFNPTEYTITDPRFEGTHYPQRPDEVQVHAATEEEWAESEFFPPADAPKIEAIQDDELPEPEQN